MAERDSKSCRYSVKRNVIGKGVCDSCGGPAVVGAIVTRCRKCRITCIDCGAPKKKPIGLRCGSCSQRICIISKRPALVEGHRKYAYQHRIRFEDITLESFGPMGNGRYAARYWNKDDRLVCIYRYQWVWIMANGPISPGCEIHHKNHTPTDDRLENLEEHPMLNHRKLHGDLKRKPRAGCLICGTMGRLKNGRPSLFCSRLCFVEYLRKFGRESMRKVSRQRNNAKLLDQA